VRRRRLFTGGVRISAHFTLSVKQAFVSMHFSACCSSTVHTRARHSSADSGTPLRTRPFVLQLNFSTLMCSFYMAQCPFGHVPLDTCMQCSFSMWLGEREEPFHLCSRDFPRLILATFSSSPRCGVRGPPVRVPSYKCFGRHVRHSTTTEQENL